MHQFKSDCRLQKIRQVLTCRIFLSKPTGLVYHHALACLSSTRLCRVVSHHTFRSAFLSAWWYTKLCFDDMQVLAELMIYNASHWFFLTFEVVSSRTQLLLSALADKRSWDKLNLISLADTKRSCLRQMMSYAMKWLCQRSCPSGKRISHPHLIVISYKIC